jgi:hypothetical protein
MSFQGESSTCGNGRVRVGGRGASGQQEATPLWLTGRTRGAYCHQALQDISISSFASLSLAFSMGFDGMNSGLICGFMVPLEREFWTLR